MGRKLGQPKPAERLLTTAARLFSRHGINATGIDRILAEAGVAKMTLYNQFGSKEGLVSAVLEREGEAWRRWFRNSVEASGASPLDRLLGIFKVLEDWFRRDDFCGCAFVNAIAEHDKTDMRLRALAAEHRRQVLAYLGELARAAGAPDPEGLAHALMLLMDGALVEALTTRQAEPARRAGELARVLLDSHLGRLDHADAA